MIKLGKVICVRSDIFNGFTCDKIYQVYQDDAHMDGDFYLMNDSNTLTYYHPLWNKFKAISEKEIRKKKLDNIEDEIR